MNNEILRTLLVYLTGAMAAGACVFFIATGKGDQDEAWMLLNLIIVALVINQARNEGAASARRSAATGASMASDPSQLVAGTDTDPR